MYISKWWDTFLRYSELIGERQKTHHEKQMVLLTFTFEKKYAHYIIIGHGNPYYNLEEYSLQMPKYKSFKMHLCCDFVNFPGQRQETVLNFTSIY